MNLICNETCFWQRLFDKNIKMQVTYEDYLNLFLLFAIRNDHIHQKDGVGLKREVIPGDDSNINPSAATFPIGHAHPLQNSPGGSALCC